MPRLLSTVRSYWPAGGFAAVTFLSAFLVFQVQPVISKALLPWFGGSPSVWTVCVLFFQALLFAGYTYAHQLTTRCPIRWQGWVHVGLLTVSLLALPIIPSEAWKPQGSENPTARILLTLSACVGLPYFLLSATGPLLQAWYSRWQSGGSPYRLYALSNAGSLLALITYPFLVEPAWETAIQGAVWSTGFCLFTVLCLVLVMTCRMTQPATAAIHEETTEDQLPTAAQRRKWVILPAFASIMLLATTNHVCQDVAVVPFLWIAPLALYLLTFIIAFDRERWYSRGWCSSLALTSILALHWALHWESSLDLPTEVVLCLSSMFFVCMICHGEMVRSKPAPRYLTQFYLFTSAGGALGGVAVALVCPLIFSTHLEMTLSFAVGVMLAMAILSAVIQEWTGPRIRARLIGRLASFAAVLFIGRVHQEQRAASAVVLKRNFYGTLCVACRNEERVRGIALIHGRIIHGFQFDDPIASHQPTTYYGPQSGVGLAFTHLGADGPLRVGAVGLGCGTVAAFGRAGDYLRFYELNPAVQEVALQHFTYLQDSPATIDVQIGDARLSLEREEPQQFDLLILDAFSGDSVPTHLLTQEAFAVYRRHLRPEGVIAVHVSNRHLRLEPVILRQAEHLKMTCVQIAQEGNQDQVLMLSNWMLLTTNEDFLSRPSVAAVARRFGKRSGPDFPLWTDQYSNLFQILNAF